MSRPTRAQLAQEVADFAAKITPADQRWAYAYRAATGRPFDPNDPEPSLVGKAARALGRVMGVDPNGVSLRLFSMYRYGSMAGARAYYSERPYWRNNDFFAVGQLEPWHIGHVYFARLRSYPHVAKVGFTRRLHERLDDIESKAKADVGEVITRVGTMADEAWWHHEWRNQVIDGEWFYWPRSTERALPLFLAQKAEAA